MYLRSLYELPSPECPDDTSVKCQVTTSSSSIEPETTSSSSIQPETINTTRDVSIKTDAPALRTLSIFLYYGTDELITFTVY